MEDFAIDIHNVSKSFKISNKKGLSGLISSSTGKQNFLALDDISISIKKGEVLGIIGTNGSGKTTLLRLISGIYKPDKGDIKVNGRLSPLMQIGAGFQGDLTAKENIVINGMLLGLTKSQIKGKINDIIEYANLEKFSELQLKHYSSGMKARLAFAIAMQVDPDILLVDEIIAVGDKNFKEKSYETFLSFKERNKTILLATHSLGNLSKICDRVLLLHKGKLITIGSPEEALQKYQEIKS